MLKLNFYSMFKNKFILFILNTLVDKFDKKYFTFK